MKFLKKVAVVEIADSIPLTMVCFISPALHVTI